VPTAGGEIEVECSEDFFSHSETGFEGIIGAALASLAALGWVDSIIRVLMFDWDELRTDDPNPGGFGGTDGDVLLLWYLTTFNHYFHVNAI
jgi:hypothetical protein